MFDEFNSYKLLYVLSACVVHFLENGGSNINPSVAQDELELLIHLI